MTCIYPSRGQHGDVHNHGARTQVPLLGKRLDDYEITLKEGDELSTIYILAPDSETAAWSALELSTDRNAQLINVRRHDEW